MTGFIMLADIRFSFDDDAAADSIVGFALKDGPEQIARYELGFAVVE
jgi:hypothetical protein